MYETSQLRKTRWSAVHPEAVNARGFDVHVLNRDVVITVVERDEAFGRHELDGFVDVAGIAFGVDEQGVTVVEPVSLLVQVFALPAFGAAVGFVVVDDVGAERHGFGASPDVGVVRLSPPEVGGRKVDGLGEDGLGTVAVRADRHPRVDGSGPFRERPAHRASTPVEQRHTRFFPRRIDLFSRPLG
jgi:hypothetical protein